MFRIHQNKTNTSSLLFIRRSIREISIDPKQLSPPCFPNYRQTNVLQVSISMGLEEYNNLASDY